MTASAQEYVSPTSFPFVLSKLPNITGSLVINLRLYQVISQLLSTVVLSLGFWCLMSSVRFTPTKTQLFISVAFTVLGSFLLQAIFPPDISYNGLTYFFVFSSLGLLFLATAHALSGRPSGKYLMVAAGILSGFIFSVKFSACIASIVLALLWFALNSKKRIFWQYYFVGLIIAPLVFLSFFQTPIQLKSQLSEIARYSSLVKSYSLSAQMQIYENDVIFTVSTIWHSLKFCLLAPILAVMVHVYIVGRARSAKIRSISLLLPFLAIGPVFLLARPDQVLLLRWYPAVYAAILLCLSVMLVFVVANIGRVDPDAAPVDRLAATSIVLLLLLPFACSAQVTRLCFRLQRAWLPCFSHFPPLHLKPFPSSAQALTDLPLSAE